MCHMTCARSHGIYASNNTRYSKKIFTFLVITSVSINRFSKFFHRPIPKETVYVSLVMTFTSTNYVAALPCEIENSQ